jgi:hypothetical protein
MDKSNGDVSPEREELCIGIEWTMRQVYPRTFLCTSHKRFRIRRTNRETGV